MTIRKFLEAAGARGWHMRPDEATEVMLQAGIENSGDERGRTAGPENSMQLMWRAMCHVAPELEWDK